MTERNGKNTRTHRRQTLRILVDYQAGGSIRCDYATTLGAGGMFLETTDELLPGTVLKMRFRLPNDEQLHELEGQVVWQRDDSSPGALLRSRGVGIKFSNSEEISRLARALEDYDL